MNEVGSDGYSANLASVHSQAEADLLGARVASMNMNRPWIGMVRNQGSLVWTDGSALDFENWKNGEPNNWGGIQHCAAIKLWGENGKWDDVGCEAVKIEHMRTGETYGHICEAAGDIKLDPLSMK